MASSGGSLIRFRRSVVAMEPPRSIDHFMESGTEPPDPRILHLRRRRQRNIGIMTISITAIVLFAYISELYEDYLERAARRAYYQTLQLPAECDELYLNGNSGSGPFALLKKALQQGTVARCEVLRRERNDALHQSIFPHPLVCLTRVFTRCLYAPFQQMGDALGDFFHSMLKHLSAPEAAWLLALVAITFLTLGSVCHQRPKGGWSGMRPPFAANAMFTQLSCSGVKTMDELESGAALLPEDENDTAGRMGWFWK
jgi:hypothetical protein